jgi:hypothetical protein
MKGLIDLWWINKGLGQLTALVANFVDNGKVRTTPDDLGKSWLDVADHPLTAYHHLNTPFPKYLVLLISAFLSLFGELLRPQGVPSPQSVRATTISSNRN